MDANTQAHDVSYATGRAFVAREYCTRYGGFPGQPHMSDARLVRFLERQAEAHDVKDADAFTEGAMEAIEALEYAAHDTRAWRDTYDRAYGDD